MFGDLSDQLVAAVGCETSRGKISDLLDACDHFSLDSGQLREDLVALLQQRLVLWVLGGEESGPQNARERRNFILHRVKLLAGDRWNGELSEDLLRELVDASTMFSPNRDLQRWGLSDLGQGALAKLLVSQGYRCAVCGVALSSNVRHESDRFGSGREPLFQMSLEHKIAFRYVGNATDFEILCRPCNSIKNDWFGVHEDGTVLSGNVLLAAVDSGVSRRMSFWTLYRSRACNVAGCSRTTADGVLFVLQRQRPHNYGVLEARCENHASDKALWIHEGVSAETEASSEEED